MYVTVCIRQHICPVWWTGVSTNDWYSNGYELCSTTHWFVSTCLWGRFPSMSSQE